MADEWDAVSSPVSSGGGEWDAVSSPVDAPAAQPPPAPENQTIPQQLRHFFEEEPGYKYPPTSPILPLKKNIKTGETEWALPPAIRSLGKGAADLMDQMEPGAAAQGIANREPLSPDALGALMVVSPSTPANNLGAAASVTPEPAVQPKTPPLPVPQQRAQDIVTRAVREEGIDPATVAQNLREAQKTGLPLRALDVATRQDGDVITQGRNLMGLADVAANQPGPGAALAGQVSARVQQQTKQLGQMLDDAVSNKNIYSIKDDALRAIDENAAPAYERAFASGDKAPIQDQLAQQLNGVRQQKSLLDGLSGGFSARGSKLKEDMAEAERMSRDPFTYGNAGKKLLEELQAKSKAHADGHGDIASKLSDLRQQEQQITELMQNVKEGTVTAAPGAVWSPRVQEFLADPDIQRGMKGELLNLQKEAVGQGVPFKPLDYGITGYDEAGMPIIAQVPNMRMLDAGKKAIDAMIENETNPLTGKLTRKGRALAIQKSGYVKELDRINPDYAEARSAYADQASRLRASQQGRNYMQMDKEEISKFFDNPSTSNAEKAYFAAGVRRDLQDKLDRVRDGSSSINQIWKENIRGRLEPVFPDKTAFDDFSKNMMLMQDMQRTNNVLARGSQTAPRQMFKEDFQQTPLTTLGKAVAGAKMAISPATQIPKAALDMMGNKIAQQVKNLDRETAGEIANILLTDDPKKWENLATVMNKSGADEKSVMYAVGSAIRKSPANTRKALVNSFQNAPAKWKRFIPSSVVASSGNSQEKKASGGSIPAHQRNIYQNYFQR